MIFSKFATLKSLPDATEREMTARHDHELGQLLPILGPIFGLVVILFHVWDHLIDADHAQAALLVRLTLVALGATAYFATRLPWNNIQRCGFIYWTHVSAIIVAEFLLQNGFLYGVSGITACIFLVCVMTFRIKTFMLILSVPTILFCALSVVSLPFLLLINHLMMIAFAIGLASILMLVIRFFRQKAFLLEQKLLHQSHHDILTGVFNRAYLTELAERELALAERHGRNLAVAMLDIDHFKQVNDNYGHAVGDQVIRILAETCMAELRTIDHFGRIGGEEFVCILPETGKEDAMLCLERLRLKIASLNVQTTQGTLHFSVSIGVALLEPQHKTWSELLKAADMAMYRAKREGRNRTILAAT
jgi:diguanylate cyclase (GGDEF)-like protein